MHSLRIVADHKIPLVEPFFKPHGQVILKPSQHIHYQDVKDAKIVLVRTTTAVNANLLTNTEVQFVGSVASGTDHIDKKWLKNAGIHLATASGANAQAAAEYVVYCIAALRTQGFLCQSLPVAGVIGCGEIGQKVIRYLRLLGFDVLCNDPPLAKSNPVFQSHPLKTLADCDLICIHTPLTTSGEFPSFHLVDEKFLRSLKKNCIILNAARGAVIDNNALLATKNLLMCLDVWENEPHIHLELLKKVLIGTPHIAGYSHEAKHRATRMIYEQAHKYFNWDASLASNKPNSASKLIVPNQSSWEKTLLSIYDPLQHTRDMKNTLLQQPHQVGTAFTLCRQQYPLRHEFSNYQLKCNGKDHRENIHDMNTLKQLGFCCDL